MGCCHRRAFKTDTSPFGDRICDHSQAKGKVTGKGWGSFTQKYPKHTVFFLTTIIEQSPIK
jgi:hypothetical protein